MDGVLLTNLTTVANSFIKYFVDEVSELSGASIFPSVLPAVPADLVDGRFVLTPTTVDEVRNFISSFDCFKSSLKLKLEIYSFIEVNS